MRTDESLPQETFRAAPDWNKNPLANGDNATIAPRFSEGGETHQGKELRHSFSGHERNHLFLNQQAQQFVDVSTLSGLDNVADSRTFVLWDFDRDGWQDIALVNANYPLLSLYRNQLGEYFPETAANQSIAVRFVGSNHSGSPSSGHGNRNGYGAKVTVTLGDRQLLREHRCGDGFAAQNSSTLLIGIGQHAKADSLRVVWPSGVVTQIADVPGGSLVTVHEQPDQSPTGKAALVEPYRASPPAGLAPPAESAASQSLEFAGAQPTAEADLHLYVTMATWCESCKKHLPQLRHLRQIMNASELQMFGLPYDRLDSSELLAEYRRQNAPPYQLLEPLPSGEWERLDATLRTTLHSPALPSTIVTSRDGQVLGAFLGVPSASAIRQLRP